MVTKIETTLQDKKKTTKNRILSLISDGTIKTKYSDIGKARNVLSSLRKVARENEDLKVVDKTRAGVVIEMWNNKSEDELVKMSLDQSQNIIDTLNKEDKGIRSKIEVYKQKTDGEWVLQ